MKRVIITLMLIFCGVITSASAQEITKEEFAESLSHVIFYGAEFEDVSISDMDNPSKVIKALVSMGVMECNSKGEFEPAKAILEIDAIKSLVTAWEIRMGGLEPAALGGYLGGYAELTPKEKKIIDKAVMIGIVPESGSISKERILEKNTATEYISQFTKTIEIMKNHGVGEVITSFRNEVGITGAPEGKITFYASLNEAAEFDDAVLVLALYSDNRLIAVSKKNYEELKNYDFCVMHTSVEIPEIEGDIKAKAFIFDGFKDLKPIYEYKLIR